MKTTGNTILITGGSAGIGLETAKAFKALGNEVILAGRDAERLREAAAGLGGAPTIRADVSDAEDAERLARTVERDFPGLNVLINNAGRAHYYARPEQAGGFEPASQEMLTNYLSVIRLTERLLPLLSRQAGAAVVNVSSIVAFSPSRRMATYAASKAALHSYTRTLRLALARAGGSPVKVFELVPPLVDTGFSRDVGGAAGIPPAAVAQALVAGMEKDEYEIRVGRTEELYRLSLRSPEDALLMMNPAAA